MSVFYYNNCWFSNVGEAFIDIGAMNLIKHLFPNENIVNFSRMNYYYISQLIAMNNNHKMLNMWEILPLGEQMNYLILSGMFACEEYLNSIEKKDFVNDIINGGETKLIFLGIGQSSYSDKETELFKRYLDKIQPELVVTRDDIVYEHFKDVANCIKGIDVAFWVKDSYNPSKYKNEKTYDVLTYNRSKESQKALKMISNNYVRAWHMQYRLKASDIKDNMLISDSPYDYLTLYGCADNVYTDLVHATIVSLQYGRHVLFERVDNRGYSIDAVDNIKKDSKGLIYVNEDDLENQKSKIFIDILKILE